MEENIGNYGMQHGGCEARRMNLKAGSRRVSPDAGWRNLISQQPGSNSSVQKLRLSIRVTSIDKKNKNSYRRMTMAYSKSVISTNIKFTDYIGNFP